MVCWSNEVRPRQPSSIQLVSSGDMPRPCLAAATRQGHRNPYRPTLGIGTKSTATQLLMDVRRYLTMAWLEDSLSGAPSNRDAKCGRNESPCISRSAAYD